MNRILIATSIAPSNLDNQKKAIDSWLRQGLDVISYNCRDEIEDLKHFFPEIRFAILSRDARDLLGKPYPYIFDILQMLLTEPYEVFGYINSDIHIFNSDTSIWESIYDNVYGDKLLYAHRMDTKSLENEERSVATSYRGGIDAFFFDKKMINIFKDDEFVIGNQFWDFWFALMPLLQGVELIEIYNPIFYHIVHEVCLSASNTFLGLKLAEKYFDSNLETAPNLIKKQTVNINYKIYFFDMKIPLPKIVINSREIVNYQNVIASQFFKEVCISVIKDNSINSNNDEKQYFFHPNDKLCYDPYSLRMMIDFMETYNYDAVVCACAFLQNDKADGMAIYSKIIHNMTNPIIERVDSIFNNRMGVLKLPLVSFTYNDFEELLINAISSLGRVYFYPTGIRTKRLVKKIIETGANLALKGLCDKDEKKWDSQILGISIFSPEILLQDCDYEFVVVNSIYENEICQELNEIMPERKVINVSTILRNIAQQE
jgi:hypothetical protein